MNEKVELLGYKINTFSFDEAVEYANSISGVPKDEYNSIYIKSDPSKAAAMWLASPSAFHAEGLMIAAYARRCVRQRPSQQRAGVLPPSLSKI